VYSCALQQSPLQTGSDVIVPGHRYRCLALIRGCTMMLYVLLTN